MKKIAFWSFVLLAVWAATSPGFVAAEEETYEPLRFLPPDAPPALWVVAEALPASGPASTESDEEEAPEALAENGGIPDPLEPVNRVFFVFNDKLYFWLLKPVATGYKAVLPQPVRISIRNFFSNLTTPVRFANSLLQADFNAASDELGRFIINSTAGVLGFFDQAKNLCHLEKQDRDFGQTLGVWGMGPVLYLNWPILGPSSVRETFGFAGDFLLDPRTYLLESPTSYVVRTVDKVNDTSLTLGEYEDLKRAALDPYVAVRDAHSEYRKNKINKVKNK
jgi:phospholipid-binding lipoprotein MlaA